MSTETDPTFTLLGEVVRALDDKKAVDLRVLRVSAQSSITDYLVLATGTSDPHLRALRVELEKVLDARSARIAGTETGDGSSGWTVVDAYQIMVHVFTPEKRDAYRLENLWSDAEDLSIDDLLHPEKAKAAKAEKAPKATGARKAAAKKTVAKPKKAKAAAAKKAAPRKKKKE